MSALTDAATFATDPDLREPLTAAVVATAIQISSEDPTAAHHAKRATLAQAVLNNPLKIVGDRFTWALSSNPTVVSKWVTGDREGAEGDFAYVLSTVWNAVAGVDGLND
jgi:hypothetical protein